MFFETNMNLVDETENTTHDPYIRIRLSDLAALKGDAEFYASEAQQYRAIRNQLVLERENLLKQIEALKAEVKHYETKTKIPYPDGDSNV